MSDFSLLPISWDTPFAESSDVSVAAASTLRIFTFPRSALKETVRQSPSLEHRLYEQALCELDDVREWMKNLGQKSAAEKIATFLFLLSHQVDPLVKAIRIISKFRSSDRTSRTFWDLRSRQTADSDVIAQGTEADESEEPVGECGLLLFLTGRCQTDWQLTAIILENPDPYQSVLRPFV